MFLPHQIGLSRPQIAKLLEGKPVNVSHEKMGTGKGEHVVHLKPQNARKMLSAYKKGKGMRLAMTPEELHETVRHGSGLWDKIKSGAKKVASLAKTALSNPEVQKLAKQGVSMGAELAGKQIAKATGNEELAKQVQGVLEKGAHSTIDSQGDLEVGLHSVKDDIKEHALGHLHNAVDEHIPDAFKPIVREAIKKGVEKLDAHPAMQALEDKADAAQELASVEVEEKGEEMTGTGTKDGMKAKMARLRAMKKGGKLNLGKMIKGALKSPIGKSLERMALAYGAPALGTAAASLIGQPELGFAAGEMLGQMGTKAIGSGVRTHRGRPMKTGGDLASESGPYKSVMRRYKGIMAGTEKIMPAVKAGARADPDVKPSSKEMTLSPYQTESSPAMHPFTPTSSIEAGGSSPRPLKAGKGLPPPMHPFIPTASPQAGGTSAGYGGKGLYGFVGHGLF